MNNNKTPEILEQLQTILMKSPETKKIVENFKTHVIKYAVHHPIKALKLKGDLDSFQKYASDRGYPSIEDMVSLMTEKEAEDLANNVFKPFIKNIKRIDIPNFSSNLSKTITEEIIYPRMEERFNVEPDQHFKNKAASIINSALGSFNDIIISAVS